MEPKKSIWRHITNGSARTMCGEEGSSTTDPLRSDCRECVQKLIEALEVKPKEMTQ